MEGFDARVREALERDGATAAASIIVRSLGPEVLGYLWVAAASWGDADDLFSQVCERIWKSLPDFRFDCPLRTWVHVIARNRVRSGHARASRAARMTAPSELLDDVAAVRTTTIESLQPEARRRLEELRRTLDEDDRTLLVLRVERELPWRDIARVMCDDGESLDRAAARLRKRFERVKDHLRNEIVPRTGRARRGP
jgi:RNA polymerase sigma-70 factor, ECF subfamily